MPSWGEPTLVQRGPPGRSWGHPLPGGPLDPIQGKPMQDTQFRIRSKFQCEVKAGYRLSRDVKRREYALDAYLFVPKILGINRDNYPKYLFYRDLQTYAELHTSPLSLGEITATDKESPFQALSASCHSLGEAPDAEAITDFEDLNRLFCCILSDSMRRHTERLEHEHDAQDKEQLIGEYRHYTQQILSRFRQLRAIIETSPSREEICSVYFLSDEFISRLVEEKTFNLLERLRGSDPQLYAKAKKGLLKLIRDELRFRRDNGYDTATERERDKERLIHRRSVLRRYMESVRFLDMRMKPEGRIVQEVVISIAAGLAMIFATAVAFLAHVRYENWTTTFFAVMVISYMFKDRIKERTRLYLTGKIQGLFFDHKNDIHGGSGRRVVGFNRESVAFVARADVDPLVMGIRHRDRLSRIDNDYVGEDILHYRRRVAIFSERFGRLHTGAPIEGLNDIIRFDVSRFVRKMENPKASFFVLEGEQYRKVLGRRVYHLDVVMKYSTRNGVLYQHFAIVMNRTGIKRIEEYPTQHTQGA